MDADIDGGEPSLSILIAFSFSHVCMCLILLLEVISESDRDGHDLPDSPLISVDRVVYDHSFLKPICTKHFGCKVRLEVESCLILSAG